MLRRLLECIAFMAIGLAALFGLLGTADTAMGAPLAQVAKLPVDKVARAKFPKAPPGLVDVLAYINRYVNTLMEPVSDIDHYGVAELWVMYPSDGKGDCEDNALTKLGLLSQAHYPMVANVKVVGVAVRVAGQKQAVGHIILAVRMPGAEVAYLDGRFDEPMTRPELVRRGYTFFDWRA